MKATVPPHACTTAHLQAVYPFMAAPGLGGRGVYIGREAMGGSFCYDPWELYAQGLLTNPNMLIAGQVGRGKSSLVKSLLVRQQVFGRKAAVLDPKGEYGPLAEALGASVISLRPGGHVRLNPLDPGPGAHELPEEEIVRRQITLLTSVVSASLGRALRPEESAACDLALDAVKRRGVTEPTLPEIVHALLQPDEYAAAKVHTTVEALALASRDVALELRRMCEGDLRGMFDKKTNVNLDWDGPLVVLDLSALFSSPALGLVMTCAIAWLQAVISRPNGGKRFVVIDEAWAVMNNVGIARWLQQSYKLSRAYGVSNVAVVHRLSDLKAAGASGSEAFALAQGLLSDTETRVVYAQPHSEVELAAQMLGLNNTEAELLPLLGRGQALWKVGRGSHLVQHQLGTLENAIVDTDARMAVRKESA
ncbi:MAG: VirB4 family type IV secretion system protein [Acidimicrobiia bacterium]